jgi:hypothetical protein
MGDDIHVGQVQVSNKVQFLILGRCQPDDIYAAHAYAASANGDIVAYGDTFADSNAHADADRDSSVDVDAYGNGHADLDGDAYSDRDAYVEPYAYTEPHAYAESYVYAYRDHRNCTRTASDSCTGNKQESCTCCGSDAGHRQGGRLFDSGCGDCDSGSFDLCGPGRGPVYRPLVGSGLWSAVTLLAV